MVDVYMLDVLQINEEISFHVLHSNWYSDDFILSWICWFENDIRNKWSKFKVNFFEGNENSCPTAIFM